MALFVGFCVAATVVADRTRDLERTGVRVDGTVVGYSAGTRVTSEYVDVEFNFAGDHRIERVLLDDSSPIYDENERVVVIVDPDDVDRLTIEGETNQSSWSVWVMIAALIGGGAGLIAGPWSLLRARRQRRLLEAEPWRRVDIQYIEVPSGNSVRGLVRIEREGVEHIGTLVSTARWTFRELGLRGVQQVDMVGRLPGYVVLRAPGSARLASARSPYTERARRRWSKPFEGTT
jgi:hypothetical protein